jgi:thioredoxin reductase (NADPH)
MISGPTPSIIDTRREQMFPTLQPFEIERVRRFGEVRSFEVGEALTRVGEVGRGLSVILAGQVDVTRYDHAGHRAHIVTHGAGAFLGELAQLAGRPALADACAREPVDALVIPPDRLRALFVAEAELGERIMRALILRRVGLLETGGGGPVIVGRAENGDVAPVRQASRPLSMRDRKGSARLFSAAARSAVKLVPRLGSRTIWDFRPASPAWL